MKKIMSFVVVMAILLSFNTVLSAQETSEEEAASLINSDSNGFITDWSKVNYISVDEYIKKYGGEDAVRQGFNEAEIKNKAMLLKAAGEEEQAVALLRERAYSKNKENNLLLSLKEGEFLGKEIQGVSDLPPDNINLSVSLKKRKENIGFNFNEYRQRITRANNTYYGTHNDGSAYKIYYTSQYPSSTDVNSYLYEPQSGSYFYKYGYSWMGDYRCSAKVTFNNTQMYCGTQSVNMYAFIGAMNGTYSVDFGFMANPSASNRNQGMYPVVNIPGSVWYVGTYPKVDLDPNSSTNPMLLETKTIKLQLTIDTLGNVETVMYHNGSMIFYRTDSITGFVSGNNATLTFFEAMSCVDKDDIYTYPNSGSYFKNVYFGSTKLYNYNDGERAFGTYGNNTYCVYICKPDKISYSYGTNSETVSIEYN